MLRWLGKVLKKRSTADHSNHANIDFKLITENSLDIILHLGADGVLRYASPSCESIFGRTPEEMLGLGTADLVHPDDLLRIADIKSHLLHGDSEIHVTSFRPKCKDGKERWLEGSANALRDPRTGAENGLVIVLRDVTERKALEDRLSAQALTDGLTGLLNRRAFDEALDRTWASTVRNRTWMSLLLLDMDNFKGFNDKYGHQVGDDCLRGVAATVMSALLRPVDLAARYGGEELAVILPETSEPGAVEVAERIRIAVEALRIPHEINTPGNHCVSVSIGVATAMSMVGGTQSMPGALLAAADTALYKAKQAGRNCVATALLLASPEE